MIDQALHRLLHRRRGRFSPVFFEMHRRRMRSSLRMQFGCLAMALLTAGATGLPLLWGVGNAMAASVAAAVLVLVLLMQAPSVAEALSARLLPYFESRVGNTKTWLAGQHLLWHSMMLDEQAECLGATPLSAFASGDPLIGGETLALFDPEDALRTCEALLRDAQAPAMPAAVRADLTKLRDALRLASERRIRFCLHLREGNSASGHEMDQRSGSYF